jgi:hypothetical protein
MRSEEPQKSSGLIYAGILYSAQFSTFKALDVLTSELLEDVPDDETKA